MNLKCLIVDDEQLARELIRSYCEKLPQLEVIGTCKNVLEAMKLMSSHQVDILFLDIQMPELSGIDFVKTMKQRPAIIFTTAYSEYALEGFELEVTDYLLKPIAFDRFIKAVNKVSQVAVSNTRNSDTITVKADHKLYKIKLDEISHIEGLREYVAFHLPQRKIVALESLKRLEEILPGNFKRVHKSYIVNTDLVDSISGNEIEMGAIKIPVGKSYKDQVMDLF